MLNVRYINDALYGFEQEYGAWLLLTRPVHVGSNPKTGYLHVERSNHRIKGIILPRDIMRKFFQDVGYLRANSNFTYGGLDDFNTIMVLARARWIPRGYEPNLNDQINYKGKRYDSVKIEEYIDGTAYVISLKNVEGQTNYNQVDVTAQDTVRMSELTGEE